MQRLPAAVCPEGPGVVREVDGEICPVSPGRLFPPQPDHRVSRLVARGKIPAHLPRFGEVESGLRRSD
jgi:hypothetical protein